MAHTHGSIKAAYSHQTIRPLPARRRPDLPCRADFADTRWQRLACPARMRYRRHCASPLWFKWTASGRCGDCATARDQSSDRGRGRHAGAGQNHQQYSIAAGSSFGCARRSLVQGYRLGISSVQQLGRQPIRADSPRCAVFWHSSGGDESGERPGKPPPMTRGGLKAR